MRLLQSQIPTATNYHQPFATNPSSVETDDFQIEFIVNRNELIDISINMVDPKDFAIEDGTCWNFSNMDFSDSLAIELLRKIDRMDWLVDLDIDYQEDCEIYWHGDNMDSINRFGL